MKNVFSLLILSSCLLLSLPSEASDRVRHVVIDIGHSAASQGARSHSGRGEYLFNQALSNEISRLLHESGVRVTFSNPSRGLTGRNVPDSGADLFVSIHHDSIQQHYLDAGRANEFSGFSLFVSKKNASFEKSLHCARWIGHSMSHYGRSPSLYHADNIKGENRAFLDRSTGVHQFDDLIVLKTSSVPSVLIEAGVIVNPYEEAILSRPKENSIAKSIAEGILRCLN